MAINNTPKPLAGTFTNTSRVFDSERWNTIATTWASETRTWIATISLMQNTPKPSIGTFNNTPKPSA